MLVYEWKCLSGVAEWKGCRTITFICKALEGGQNAGSF